MKSKIRFMGSSGVGKSTLARYVANRYCLPLLSGATKIASEKSGVKIDTNHPDIGDSGHFQMAVWAAQLELERPHYESDTGFVSDRGVDLLAYTAKRSRAAAKIFCSKEFAAYVDRMRTSVNFFVRPHPDVRAPLDGRRDGFLTPEWVWAVDGVIEYILEANEVPYVVISSPSMKDRVATIDAVHGLLPK